MILKVQSESQRGRSATNHFDEITPSHGRPAASTLEGFEVRLADVRFGSKADMCSAKRYVRFTPKADMCSALGDVRFVPKADISDVDLLKQKDHHAPRGEETMAKMMKTAERAFA